MPTSHPKILYPHSPLPYWKSIIQYYPPLSEMQHHIPSLLLLLWLGVFVKHPTAHWQNFTLTEPKGMISTLLEENPFSASKCRNIPGLFTRQSQRGASELHNSLSPKIAPWLPVRHLPSSPHPHSHARAPRGYSRSVTEALDLQEVEGEVRHDLTAPLAPACLSPFPKNLP